MTVAERIDPQQIGVAILAGGAASRLPGKLALPAGDVPLLVRVYRNVGASRTAYVACAALPPGLDAQLPCPMVVDRRPGAGPLAALADVLAAMPTRIVFAVAGDAPFVDERVIDALAARWEPGDEAVVPVHDRDGRRQFEPLAALYDRLAVMRETYDLLAAGKRSLHALLERLRTRTVRIDDARLFLNVNTPDDYARLRKELGPS